MLKGYDLDRYGESLGVKRAHYIFTSESDELYMERINEEISKKQHQDRKEPTEISVKCDGAKFKFGDYLTTSSPYGAKYQYMVLAYVSEKSAYLVEYPFGFEIDNDDISKFNLPTYFLGKKAKWVHEEYANQ